MDEAYRQHSHHSRRKNRSTTNLNHLTLAPLTSKLPLDDEAYTVEDYPPPPHTTSYLDAKSTPTTPGILSRSPGHSRNRSGRRSSVPHVHFPLPKSKSASHLAPADLKLQTRKTISGTTTPTHPRRQNKKGGDDETGDQDAAWLLRAGVLMSSEAREYKGQMWLTSRASSTSLAGPRDVEDELLEREIERERELMFRQESRRGSIEGGGAESGRRSARASRPGSRSGSRVGSRSQLFTPIEGRHSEDGYFSRSPVAAAGDEYVQGPDFVNLDEKLEAIVQDTSQEDEAAIRKLVRGEMAGRGSWFRWPLFAVEEQEDSDADEEDDDNERAAQAQAARRRSSVRHFEGVTNAPKEEIPPPDPQQGGWQDAAWLLSVASKVIL
ncbi:hypothetical protein F5X68DRAFT_80672 [Plectosphaerella plurivora]|uniref:Uncharacterized protein n=1 Tax=Plectosphaerella plurivora TaxID=936078 RepID=A0A9P8VD50_9PEZI|nr:hypothetical protein F5X68DRAFT_80672 [Plectosphaerella plurivora]